VKLASLSLAPIPLLMAFLSLKNLLFGLEPIIEFRARLIAALDIQFVSATLDAFFERKRLDRGFPCFRGCWHGITSGDDGSTTNVRLEGRTDPVLDFLRRSDPAGFYSSLLGGTEPRGVAGALETALTRFEEVGNANV
jgi:hypothetical protein